MSRSRTLPLGALRAFEAAARHLSFGSAAQELGVTPAAVSHQIRALEDRIGRQLFVRRNRAVLLSPSGVKLSGPLTELFAKMTALVTELSVRGIASLEVTAMPSFATKWLAPRLARFSVAHPDCRVRLVASDDLVDFKHSSADVGVRYGRGDYKSLHAEKLLAATAVPVCSKAFAREHAARIKTPAELMRLPLLHDETSLIAGDLPNWPRWLEAAGVRGATIKPRLVFDSAHMAIEAALAGQGIALGLKPLVNDDLTAGRLVRLSDVELPSAFSFWFVCPPARLKDPRIAQFRDWLRAEAGA